LRHRSLTTQSARPRAKRLFLAAGWQLAFFWILSASVARAADSFDVEAELPAGCGSAAEFQREVLQRLGAGVTAPRTTLRIAPEGAGYRLDMRVGSEHRQFVDADCLALFRAAIVVTSAITLSENGERAVRAPSPPPVPGEPREPREGREPREVGPAGREGTAGRERTARHDGTALEFDVGLGAGLDLGLEPQAAPAFELLGKASLRRVGVAASLRYLAPRSQRDASGRGVTVQAVGAQLLGVYRAPGALEFGLGAAAYQLFGTGLGSGARDGSAWAWGPALSLGFLPVRTRWFWFGLAGELRWNLVRPRFEFLNYGEIFSASALSGGIFLQIGPRFP
jgi:hypothetical protein